MGSNTMRVVAGVLVVLAIVLALIAFRMSRNFAANTEAQTAADTQKPPAVPQTLLVVAIKPLMANVAISKDAVSLKSVEVAPKDYFASVDDVVGRTPLVDVDVGAPLTPRFFKEANQLVRLIPAGTQAISLELNDVLGVGNFVKSGDVVDVLLYLKNDNPNKVEPAQARVLLKNVLVLAYDERITAPPSGVKTDDANSAGGAPQQQRQGGNRKRTVVLAIPEKEATRVMLGASLGDIRLALHGLPPTDVAVTDASASATMPPTPSSLGTPSNPVAANTVVASPPILPLNDAAKTPPPQTKPQPPDNVITVSELADIRAKSKTGAPVKRYSVQIYKGGKRETVYP